MTKRPNFTEKTRSIINKTAKIENLGDFLSENVVSPLKDKNNDNISLISPHLKSNTSSEEQHFSEIENKISREEFRLNHQLAERLRLASFSLRKNKTQIVKEALETYLEKIGF